QLCSQASEKVCQEHRPLQEIGKEPRAYPPYDSHPNANNANTDGTLTVYFNHFRSWTKIERSPAYGHFLAVSIPSPLLLLLLLLLLSLHSSLDLSLSSHKPSFPSRKRVASLPLFIPAERA
ncbi:unnamed protein product, partial [Chrysoparadoxa australica]